jgi:hypothetical protein
MSSTAHNHHGRFLQYNFDPDFIEVEGILGFKLAAHQRGLSP